MFGNPAHAIYHYHCEYSTGETFSLITGIKLSLLLLQGTFLKWFSSCGRADLVVTVVVPYCCGHFLKMKSCHVTPVLERSTLSWHWGIF